MVSKGIRLLEICLEIVNNCEFTIFILMYHPVHPVVYRYKYLKLKSRFYFNCGLSSLYFITNYTKIYMGFITVVFISKALFRNWTKAFLFIHFLICSFISLYRKRFDWVWATFIAEPPSATWELIISAQARGCTQCQHAARGHATDGHDTQTYSLIALLSSASGRTKVFISFFDLLLFCC